MIAGRYTLEREVGRGGMGAVWLGRDEVLGRAVALKRIGTSAEVDRHALARAEREARLAARLNHPHVVAVFDLVLEDDQRWLVMEYVDGVTLAQLVREQGALSPDRAATLLAQAADALAAAHAAGIVHRDVKPSNMLVSHHGQVKLSDFGIARAEADSALTQTGLVTGSPAYLAPEVASGQPATDASDVWSLGATLFHALAGRPPYEVGENVLGTLYRIVHEEPPRLDDAGWLAPLLAATMTRDPQARWSMADVRDFLQQGPVDRSVRAAATAGGSTDPTRTQVLSAVAAGTASGSATPVAEPALTDPAPAPAPGSARRRRGGPLVPVLVAVAVVLVAAVAGWALLAGGDDSGTPSAQSSSKQSGGGGGSPSQQPTGPTAQGMETFIRDYLTTVTTDPEAAFAMLTPGFQDASGGLEGYRGFWDTIRTAQVSSFTGVDPGQLTIGYTVDYTRRDGSTASDEVSLRLVYQNGEYLIDGEA